MRLGVAVVISAMALAGAAEANPLWARHPDRDDMKRAFPREARGVREPGVVELTCKVNAERRLEDCAVTKESPEGVGFGEAALTLVPKFRMRSAVNGQKVAPGTVVGVPIEFDVD